MIVFRPRWLHASLVVLSFMGMSCNLTSNNEAKYRPGISVTNMEEDETVLITTRLSRTGSPFTAEWVERVDKDRGRRASFNQTTSNWPHDIPYIIDSSFAGDRVTFREVLDHISSRLCVTFHDVADTYDPREVNWLTNHGFKTNAYVSVKGGSGCSAMHGMGTNPGPKVVYPCEDFGINLHEMLHVLGVIHTHQGRIRDSYMSINEADIKDSLVDAYSKVTAPTLINDFFDPDSIMMYGDRTWNLDGLETYTPIRDDFFQLAISFSEESVVFLELNAIYRCNELFCNNDQTDCGPGYHTLINGRCRCVCPDELDYNTNCRTHIDGPNTDIPWPDTQIILYGTAKCPTGFDPEPAILPLSGTYRLTQQFVPERYPYVNGSTNLYLCKKSTPVNSDDVNWKSWPRGGQYCFVKPLGQDCGGVFENGAIQFETLNISEPVGDVGNVTVDGRMVTINYCCRNRDHWGLVMDLPNADPFNLVARYQRCPVVRGMKGTNSQLTFWTSSSRSFGPNPPLSFFYAQNFIHYQCNYKPPVYGCSETYTLNSTTRSVTVTTPGFETSREPNRRCFYSFNVPAQSRLRLTLNQFYTSSNDEFLIKRFHQWQNPYSMTRDNLVYQLVSEGNYLSLQYWSSWESATNKGVNFTVDVVLAEEMCYDVATKGADYYGEKSVTETFEPCVPWEKATSCDDFPFDGLNGISLLESGSSCRNPGGSLLQPWCYTFVRGSVCHKRYCDVCNIQSPKDVLLTCSTLNATVPDFCETAVERFACFQTCGFSQQIYTPATCSPPILPSDVYTAGGLKSVYKEGEVINVTCTTSGSLVNIIRCTKTGWSGQALACDVSDTCYDKIPNCQNVLTSFPEFCTDPRSATSGEMYCKRSCGHCPGDNQCSDPVGITYTRTSESAVISPGQSMTFECQDHLYHVGGDLHRACSTSGTLLGSEPVCLATPVPVDIHLEKVRSRKATLKQNLAFLLDVDGYRIPFNGKVTRWYYYCQNYGLLNFIVFRRSGTTYTYVGSNSVRCEPKWRRTYNVPLDNQIDVFENDIFGAFSHVSTTLSVTDCDDAEVQILSLPAMNISSTDDLRSATGDIFQGRKCAVPSLGLRVEP
ncbi:uncharacterized protein LOC131932203 [Physella acuta]|uniref:uncharacterized protein LOC131932203 n=1 Tax=Physella acuta TaxID=109671 RepID=UPI0027DE8FFB|nr:uncharacterized protein LOC131932203 [Physella acuta]